MKEFFDSEILLNKSNVISVIYFTDNVILSHSNSKKNNRKNLMLK